MVRGVSHDNGEIATVRVNDRPARIVAPHAGVADWVITLPAADQREIIAKATDTAGNGELTPHRVFEPDR